MEQSGDKWLQWRHRGIGSSDASCIMGINPWKSTYALWQEKVTDDPPEHKDNYAMARGRALEPTVRELYQMQRDISMEPALFVHKEYPFLKASLDGYCEKEHAAIEIKCPGEATHQIAQDGAVPDYYYAQIQHQILVGDLKWVDYVSYRDEDLRVIRVVPDLEYIEDYLKKAISFWWQVTERVEPDLSKDDFKVVNDQNISELVDAYVEAKRIATQAVEGLDLAKDALTEAFAALGHPNAVCGPVKYSEIKRRGPINYKSIPELKSVNLDDYRGEDLIYPKLTVAKGVK